VLTDPGRSSCIPSLALLATLLSWLPLAVHAGDDEWTRIAPDGGTVDGLVATSSDVYLFSGHRIYVSADGGNSWSLLAGLGSTITALAVDGQTLFAGTSRNGILRSIDGGNTWTDLSLEGLPAAVTSIIVSHDGLNRIYAGLGGNLFEGEDTDHSGVFVSMDNGDTWTKTAASPRDRRITSLAVDPLDLNTLYAGTVEDGVFRTSDGGQTWDNVTRSAFIELNVQDIAIAPDDSDRIYVSSFLSSLILFSGDRGETWEVLNDGLPPRDLQLQAIAFDPDDSHNMYVAYSDVDEESPVYHSADGGATWVPLDKPRAAQQAPDGYALLPADEGGLLFGSNRGVWQVSADGSSWTAANAGFDSAKVLHFAIAGDGSGRVAAVNDSSFLFLRDEEDGPWVEIPGSFTRPGFLAVAINPVDSDEIWLGQASAEGLWKSIDGETFTPQSTMPPDSVVSAVAIDPLAPAHVLAIEETESEVHHSTSGGANWSVIADEIPEGGANPWVHQLVLAATNPDVAYLATHNGLLRSGDGGLTWTELVVGDGSESRVFGLAVDPGDHDVVYASPFLSSVYKSEDGGETWMELSGIDSAQELAIDSRDGRRLLAADGEDILASIDGGQSWASIAKNLPTTFSGRRTVSDIQFDPVIEDRYYVAVNGFLYVYDGALPAADDHGDGDIGGGASAGGGGSGGGGAFGLLMIGLLGGCARRLQIAQVAPRTACSILPTSIFRISSIASNARFATSPPLAIASVSTRGVICHDRPHLSLHQPQALSSPPLPTIAFQ
jgi:photosystem II stability/assembly factor-like uncharacterized protein